MSNDFTQWGVRQWIVWSLWVGLLCGCPLVSLLLAKVTAELGLVPIWTMAVLGGMIFSSRAIFRPLGWVSFLSAFVVVISILCSYAMIYVHGGVIDSSTNEPVHNIDVCIYFSTITFTTVGFGDFRPTEETRMIAASESLLGFLVLGVFLACLVKSLGRLVQDIKRTNTEIEG